MRGSAGLRTVVAQIGRRMHEARLVAGADGNISVRTAPNRLLVTPSGVAKGRLSPEDLVVCDLSGRMLAGRRPSSELGMHLAVYGRRPDVRAAIHAHPPWVIAASMQSRLRFDFAPEAVVALGGVVNVDYARPGTPAVALGIEPHLDDHNAFILGRHGSLTLGVDLEQAFLRLEALEHSCKVAILALVGGDLPPLPAAEVIALRVAAGQMEPVRAANPVRGGSRVRVSDEEALVLGLSKYPKG